MTRKRYGSFPDIKKIAFLSLLCQAAKSSNIELASYKYVIIHSYTNNTNMHKQRDLRSSYIQIYTYTHIQIQEITLSLSLSLSLKHTHVHTHIYTLFSHNFWIKTLFCHLVLTSMFCFKNCLSSKSSSVVVGLLIK